jgi:flagellar export protein FliJ
MRISNAPARQVTMKRFRFSLQALLTVRQREEHLAAERYAATLAARHCAAADLAAAQEDAHRAAEFFRTSIETATRAGEISRWRDHYEVLNDRCTRAAEILEAAEKAVAPALAEMLRARRQREVVEECRAKHRVRHEREMARMAHRLQDDLAFRRFTPALVWRGND